VDQLPKCAVWYLAVCENKARVIKNQSGANSGKTRAYKLKEYVCIAWLHVNVQKFLFYYFMYRERDFKLKIETQNEIGKGLLCEKDYNFEIFQTGHENV
jgi:hypothetical protein